MRYTIAFALCLLLNVYTPAAFADADFVSLFDGKSLEGWKAADPSYWSVEDGAITGRISAEHPCTVNQYLVWEGGELADFQITLEARLSGEGAINNGFQFRSRQLPDNDVCGYQMDNNLETPWLVRLYDEYGRHTLAMRGEQTVFDMDGDRVTTPLPEAAGDAWFTLGEWHQYDLTCEGSLITLKVDGRIAAVVDDRDARRAEAQGIFALQLHSGPATVAQFRNIQLREIKKATPPANDPPTEREAQRLDVIATAAAWWDLDTGGHGAPRPLRHIPAFDQLQLNVKSAGPGSIPGAKCVLLDGAYFEATPHLGAGEHTVTVFARLRDPQGRWDAALVAKQDDPERVEFRLSAEHHEGDPGPVVAFTVETEIGPARVAFPLAGVDLTAWHDVAARYDGSRLTLFFDGEPVASEACTGAVREAEAPLLIAAELRSGEPVRHFRGEMEAVGVWNSALPNDDIGLLTRK